MSSRRESQVRACPRAASGSTRIVRRPSSRVVKDDSERVSLAAQHAAHAMPEIRPVEAA